MIPGHSSSLIHCAGELARFAALHKQTQATSIFIIKGQQHKKKRKRRIYSIVLYSIYPECYAPAAEVNEQFTFQHAA